MNKAQTTYEEIFTVLLQLEPGIKPKHIMVDFERALINAASKHFVECEVHGCNFHFGQAIWRHIQSVGLQSEYSNNAEFAHNIKMLIALSFVHPEDVVKAFEELVQSDFWLDDEKKAFNAEKQNLLAYFESTYIGVMGRFTQSRKKALFGIELWNMFHCTINGESFYFVFSSFKQKLFCFIFCRERVASY